MVFLNTDMCFRILILYFIFFALSGCASTQQAASQVSTLETVSPDTAARNNQTVILLHGLNRSARSMRKMSMALAADGYDVCSINYPSRYFTVATLANEYVLPKINACVSTTTEAVNFVTHSMGGIIVRQLDEDLKFYPQGRIVMLSPPNQGSEVVDRMSNTWYFQQLAGPAGNELGTTEAGLPKSLPKPTMPFAVIAARHSNSAMSFIIPGDDDGKVSLQNMQLDNMEEFIIVNSTHSFMMGNAQTIQYVLHFLKNGCFKCN